MVWYQSWHGTYNQLILITLYYHICLIFRCIINNNQFNYKSGIRTRSGKLYFGSINGLMAVDPNNIKRPHVTAPLYITKLLIFNEELKVNEKGSPLTNSIIYTNEVHLNHDQNSIGFEFASLSYSSSSNYKYLHFLILEELLQFHHLIILQQQNLFQFHSIFF